MSYFWILDEFGLNSLVWLSWPCEVRLAVTLVLKIWLCISDDSSCNMLTCLVVLL